MKLLSTIAALLLTLAPMLANAQNIDAPRMVIMSGGVALVCHTDRERTTSKKLVWVCDRYATMKPIATRNLSTPFGDYAGPLAQFAQFAPFGNGGPVLSCADTTLTCTNNYQVQLNAANATTITGGWTFSTAPTSFSAPINSSALISSNAGNGNCTNAPATITGFCTGYNGTTNFVGVAIGPQSTASAWNCSASCATSNSEKICLFPMKSTGVGAGQCIFATTSGVITDSSWFMGNSVSMQGNNFVGVPKIGTNSACSGTTPLTSPATNSLNCRITAAASSAVLTFGTAYAATPICVVADETTTTSAVKVAVTTTTVTLTPPGATDVLDVICIGNGGV